MSELMRVGIIGDGQLGRMDAEANIYGNLGKEITVLGVENPDVSKSPAAQIPGVHQLYGENLYDPEALRELVETNDVTTIEVEHVGSDTLIALEAAGHNIQPSPHTIKTIQNKFNQKLHLESYGLTVADFLTVSGHSSLHAVRKELGQSLMIKSATGAYDGRGNLLLTEDMSWSDVEAKFGADNLNLYAERLVPFVRELSLVGVRNYAGHIASYPVVETVHDANICHTVFAPARLSPGVTRKATELGLATIESFQGAGVFAVEMFETEDGDVVVNEVAPRVHNSGHWTIEGAETSQFENHLRAITAMPIGPTSMRHAYKAAVMINLLGKQTGELDGQLVTHASEPGAAYAHSYGKTLKPARKVGHVTGVGQSMDEAQSNAESAYEQIAPLL